MRFPVAWLREFVEITVPPAALADRLTAAGLVVDAIEGERDAAVLDVDVPTNRPDCMNVYGLAREIAALSERRLAPYPSGAPEAGGCPAASESASVQIDAQDLCRRYCARVVRGVEVAPSPEWIVRRLEAAGLNAVNNVVDVTNYVLFELGHPLHAFDLATLRERRIIVRRARRGEALQTLDGVARHLDPEMLVIADAQRPVALAGIMGGAATMISTGTSDILLESAHFDPVCVRRTAKRLGLSTDASYRFERGADIEVAHVAIDRTAALLAQVAGGEVAPGLIDVRAAGAMDRRTIRLRVPRVEMLLGVKVEPARAASALESLGFEFERSGDGFEVTVPHHRQDVTREVDLIEEIGRSVGYETIPESLPQIVGIGEVHRFAHRREATLRESLRSSGYNEVITYSFVSSEWDWLLREEGVAAVALSNPMAEGQEVLRSTVFPGLVQTLRHNLNRGVRDVRIFEVGRVFRRVDAPGDPSDRKHPPAPGRDEIQTAGIAATGLARMRHWAEPARGADFFDVKGALEEAFSRLHLEPSFAPLSGQHPFRPGACASVLCGGKAVGRLGVLSPEIGARIGIKPEVALAELNLAALFALPEPPVSFSPLPRYPSASRDLALVVREEIPWSEVESTIREAGGEVVTKVSVFDRYTGKGVPAGSVSLAVNVVYQHPDRTLSSEEIIAAESQVLSALRDRHGITLRS